MYHETFIIGNLGGDPEGFGEGDRRGCRFSVAVNEKWDGGEHTEWYRVTCWGKTADFPLEYLKKGSKVAIKGVQRTTQYTDNAGETKYSTSLNARRVIGLGRTVVDEPDFP